MRPVSRTHCAVLVALLLVAALAAGLATPAAADDHSIEIQHEGETLTLDPAPNQTIRGTSTLEPGTEVYVRIRATGENPFIKSRATTIGPEGDFAVTFDLSDIEPTTFTVSVSAANSSATTRVEGRIGEPGTTTSQTLDLPTDRTVSYGDVARIPLSMPAGERAILRIGNPDGGYGVVVRATDRDEDGQVTVTFDTAAAGTPDPTIGVEGADQFEILDPEPALDGALPSGTYDLALAADADSDPVAIGQLTVEAGAATTTRHSDPGAPEHVVPPLSDPFWRTTAPGIAGVLALLSGVASLLISRR